MYTKINQLLEEGYTFSISKTISKAWQVAKSSWASYLGFFLVFMLMTLITFVIPFIGIFIVYLVIYPAFIGGFALYTERKLHGQPVDFSTFFDGFKFLGQLIPYLLLLYVFQLIASIPIFIVLAKMGMFEMMQAGFSGDIESMQTTMMSMFMYAYSGTSILLYLLGLVLSIAVLILYWWAPYFILFHGMGFWQAMESSRKLVLKKIGKHFGLLLALTGYFLIIYFVFIFLMIMLAAQSLMLSIILSLFLGVVVFLWTTTTMASPLVAFDEVVGTREDDDFTEDLTEHLVG